MSRHGYPFRLSLIAAMARNRVIGRDGGLPWRLPDDMKWFKRTTTGHSVIMGRKDFESHNTPLPNRRNILLTRDRDYEAPSGIIVTHSLEEALSEVDTGDAEPFVIGGGVVYEQALPLVDRMYLTHVEAAVEGDVLFPAFDDTEWHVKTLERHAADERHFAAFEIRQYDRID